MFQRVNVEAGGNVQAGAWAQVKACDPGKNTSCGSSGASGAKTRIGIDPNGGTNPHDGDVVWSNWVEPHDKWLQMKVSATTTGTTATLFLYSTQSKTARINKTWWDAASLSGGGPGGAAAGAADTAAAAPVVAAPPEVPFVAPQRAGDDGSIVHSVRPGDTIDSIAVAYDMTRNDLLALNPDITNPRIISVGQRIVVRRAEGEAAPQESRPAAEAGAAGSEAGAAPQAQPLRRDDSPAPVVAAALSAANPLAASASVCVTLFDDVNRNRLREPQEVPLANGLMLLTGSDSEARLATGEEARCFESLQGGAYLLQIEAPEGYGLTAPGQLQLNAPAAARLNLDVGAAAGVQPAVPPEPDVEPLLREEPLTQDTSAPPLQTLLDNIGFVAFALAGVVLLAGLALTFSLWRR